jgi:hypothetical protein
MFPSGANPCTNDYQYTYTGVMPRFCTGGCPGECQPGTAVCYTKRECEKSIPTGWSQCVAFYDFCQPRLDCAGCWCYPCGYASETVINVYVVYDSCGG